MNSVACFVQTAQVSQTQKTVTVLSEYEIIGKQEHTQSKNSFPVTAQSSAKSRHSKQTSTHYKKNPNQTYKQTKKCTSNQPTVKKRAPKPRRKVLGVNCGSVLTLTYIQFF